MTKNDAVERAVEFAEGLKSLRDNVGTLLQQCDLHTIALAEALQALQTSRPDAGDEEAFSNIVVEAMQGAWNDWCSDTGCFPDDFEWRGPNGKLFFKAGKWSANVAKTIRAAIKSGDNAFLPTTDYYDPEKLTTEQRAQYERLIGSALLHAKTWAPTDKEYMAAKTGAHRAVIGLIKHGLLPPTSEGV